MREKELQPEKPCMREFRVLFHVQAEHEPAALDEVYKRLKMGGEADLIREVKP